MIIGYIYAVTVVVAYLEQHKLYNKINNRLYEEKYVRKSDNSLKQDLKELLYWFIPIYNVVSPAYNLNNFDQYYERIKNNLMDAGNLESIEIISDSLGQEEVEFVLEDNNSSYEKDTSIKQQIQDLKKERENLINDEQVEISKQYRKIDIN